MALDVTGRVLRLSDNVYVSLCLVNNEWTITLPTQVWSSEMLHWDEYRTQRGVNDSTPALSTLFPRFDSTNLLMRSFELAGSRYIPRSVATQQHLYEQSEQTFCSEMQHWDDLRRSRGMLSTTEPLMSTLFAQWDFREFSFYTPGSGTLVTWKAHSVALRKLQSETQTFCSEMQHWDDLQRAKTGALPQLSMVALFSQDT